MQHICEPGGQYFLSTSLLLTSLALLPFLLPRHDDSTPVGFAPFINSASPLRGRQSSGLF